MNRNRTWSLYGHSNIDLHDVKRVKIRKDCELNDLGHLYKRLRLRSVKQNLRVRLLSDLIWRLICDCWDSESQKTSYEYNFVFNEELSYWEATQKFAQFICSLYTFRKDKEEF